MLLDNRSGFHGSNELRNQSCSECHGDHFGRDFDMLHFSPDTFKHELTGYQLLDTHRNLDCEKCHNPKNITDEKLSKKESTYLGLVQSCNSCHENIHKPSLGNDCSKCHTITKFNNVESFDHSSTDFQITGKHIGLKCDQCHKRNNDNKMVEFGISNHNTCVTCHSDIHKQKFGKSCTTCHTTKSFKIINNVESFDHSITDHVLNGKHNSISCNKCHTENFSPKATKFSCNDCHEDYHKGEFTENNIVNCASCHNESSFSPSTFSIEHHNQLNFKLKDKHRDVSCDKCHKKENKWKFRNISGNCNDCHRSPHTTVIESSYIQGDNCTSCHKEDSWENIHFDHSRTNYLLLGKHESASCKKCHYRLDDTNKIIQKFKLNGQDCLQCHKTHHKEKIIKEKYANCLSCHYYDTWDNIVFDHTQTGFDLTGAHVKTSCEKCHKKVDINGSNQLNYLIKDSKCKDCH